MGTMSGMTESVRSPGHANRLGPWLGKTTTSARGRPRPTLRDVAHAAGVSVWTVSNAYSHPDRVASATRERVLAAASAIGYAGPDPAARSLALGRTRHRGLRGATATPSRSSPTPPRR